MVDAPTPEPDDALADLSEDEQAELVERTANELDEADSELPQPPQDGTYTPEAE